MDAEAFNARMDRIINFVTCAHLYHNFNAYSIKQENKREVKMYILEMLKS